MQATNPEGCKDNRLAPIRPSQEQLRRYVWVAVFFFLLHAFFMLDRYGQLPVAPVLGDEVIINDAALSLGSGHGYAATSFADSRYGIDHLFAHFPPLYALTESLSVRAFGISVYSLRLTTTLMSIAANAVFLCLLYGLCRADLLSPGFAMLVGGIYSTFTPLIIVSRMARMESMIEFLTLLALAAIFRAITRPESPSADGWLIVAGALAGLCMAVHPEAVTSMLVLAPLTLFATPGHVRAKIVACVVAAVTPVAICLLTFGKQSSVALQQFLQILHRETPPDIKLGRWMVSAPHERNLSALTLNVLFFCVLLLLVLLPIAYLFVRLRVRGLSIRYTVSACFATVAVLELAVILFGLHVNTRRYEATLGALLIGLTVVAAGSAPPRRWHIVLGGLLIFVQVLGVAAYLHARKDRIMAMNPYRFRPVVQSLPPGISIVASPELWLTLRQSGRSFALLYPGYDGMDNWKKEGGNPLRQFDAVILAESDVPERYLESDAAAGRTKCTYHLGGDEIKVYLRGNVASFCH